MCSAIWRLAPSTAQDWRRTAGCPRSLPRSAARCPARGWTPASHDNCVEVEAGQYRDEHHRLRQVGNPLERLADHKCVENCQFSAEVGPNPPTRVRRACVRGIPPRVASELRASSRSRGCGCEPSHARRLARWQSLWRTCLRRAGLVPPIAAGSG